jgi:cytochrome P450
MAAEQDVNDFTDSAFSGMDINIRRNPQSTYAAMRAAGPVARVGDGRVVVSTLEATNEVLRHPEVYSSLLTTGHLGNVRPLIPIELDPPDQRKFRKILDPLFTPKQLEYLNEPLEKLINELIDDFIDEPEIDFAERFSVPFPSQVFLTMFGLPLEERPSFLAMKNGIIRPFDVLGVAMNDPRAEEYKAKTVQSIYDYFNKVLYEREKEPKDDLLSGFITAEVDGERLTREDILDICFLLLIAGLDTVSASLDCFFRYLAEHPEERAKIIDDPDLSPLVVEELLRWESPVQLVARVAAQDTELYGCPIHAGDVVNPFLGAANTDGDVFPDPDEVIWGRKANRHLAFGGGIHRCLGSNLARLELRIALRVWHSRIPHYRIKPGAELDYGLGVRSVASFPMILGESI